MAEMTKREMRERQLSNLSDVFDRVRGAVDDLVQQGHRRRQALCEAYKWAQCPLGLRSGLRRLKKAKQFLKDYSRDLDQTRCAISEILDELGEWA